ncbi:hypothetical protein QYM36_002706 [Artemia franciscana]|uniref:Uncharacterized protein n=1 Tax=Artemia franciscana TaxID=6661 RepID=A0AA88LHV3_ARTSF|nr:hypothetical protein QYM36_002706 [Artemia franciscana]
MIGLNGSPANLSILSACAPNRKAPVTANDGFFSELQQVSFSVHARDYLIAAGDSNRRVGLSDAPTQVHGKVGLGHRIDNGKRLANYSLTNHLVVINTIFQHKPNHLLMWHSNDGVTNALIDFILVHQLWISSVMESSSYNGAGEG